MHLPTYLALITSSILFGLFKAVVLWNTNRLLFAVSVFTVIVTLFGAALQSVKVDDFQFKWMVFYIVPLALLALSATLKTNEINDFAFELLGESPPPHIIPGESQDYRNAALGHWAALVFPFIAWLLAKIVHIFIEFKNRKKS